MSEIKKTRAQLVDELVKARVRIAVLEVSDTEHGQAIQPEQLAVVNRIAEAVSNTLDLDTLMERVYQETLSIFQADAFFIALYDEQAGELDFCFKMDEGTRQPPERLPLGIGLTSYVVTEKKSLVIRDLEQEQDRLPEGMPSGTGKLPASWLGAPLMVGERVIGVVNVQAYRPYAWDEEDERLFFTIADQVAVSLENAYLFQERERRVRQMEAINEVGQAITSVLDPDTVLDQIVDITKARFDQYFVGISLVKEDTLIFWSGSTLGDSNVRPEFNRVGIPLTHRPSLVVEAARTGQPVLVNDALSDPRFLVSEELPDTRSELCLPIEAKGRVIGVLDVESDRPFAYDQADVALFQFLANQAGVAIENAHLFEETRTRVEELAVLNEMSRTLTAMLDVDEVIESLYHHASRLIDTSHFYVALYDPEQDMVSFPLYIEEGQTVRQEQFRGGKGLTGYVIRTREPLLIEDNVAARVEELGIEAVRLESVSWLGVPMTLGGRVVGVISAHSHTIPRLYNERHRDLMVAIANQAAVAIENARLYEKVQQELAERRQAEEALQKAYEEVEKQVEERTAELQREVAERERAQAESQRLQQEVIEAQRLAIQELSTPIIPVMDRIIVMPLIGSIDTMRAKDTMRTLLAGIREHRAKIVILDITGVAIVDSGVANHLNKTIQAARLKGARTIVTGISDAVAETIVDLGIDWGEIETLTDLRTGLIVALNSLGIRLTRGRAGRSGK